MTACPKCGKDIEVAASKWTGGKGTKNSMVAQCFVCGSCGTSHVSWRDKSGKMKTMRRKAGR